MNSKYFSCQPFFPWIVEKKYFLDYFCVFIFLNAVFLENYLFSWVCCYFIQLHYSSTCLIPKHSDWTWNNLHLKPTLPPTSCQLFTYEHVRWVMIHVSLHILSFLWQWIQFVYGKSKGFLSLKTSLNCLNSMLPKSSRTLYSDLH